LSLKKFVKSDIHAAQVQILRKAKENRKLKDYEYLISL
jgi:hypothetical protein